MRVRILRIHLLINQMADGTRHSSLPQELIIEEFDIVSKCFCFGVNVRDVLVYGWKYIHATFFVIATWKTIMSIKLCLKLKWLLHFIELYYVGKWSKKLIRKFIMTDLEGGGAQFMCMFSCVCYELFACVS